MPIVLGSAAIIILDRIANLKYYTSTYQYSYLFDSLRGYSDLDLIAHSEVLFKVYSEYR